jgi:hypothetical protein
MGDPRSIVSASAVAACTRLPYAYMPESHLQFS